MEPASIGAIITFFLAVGIEMIIGTVKHIQIYKGKDTLNNMILGIVTIRSWGFLEWFMNTPAHHRVHHASNPQYLDKNYAAVFIIWDRMFGTFEPEVEDPVNGLIHNLETDNIFVVGFHEFIAIFKDLSQADSFSEGLHILFDHPGWKISKQSHKKFLASLQKKA